MITVNELFSGIGAQVAALKRLGIEYKVVGISEIDRFAIQSYEAINGKTRNYGDISKVERLDYADLWTYSSPCQDFSIAGRQKGLRDENGEQTRSGLLLEVERLLKTAIAEGKAPKYLLLENVKNLVGKKFRPDFENWLSTLEELGYKNYWKVLNAKDYGVPQNRERVFVVSVAEGGFEFPEPVGLTIRLKDVLETNVDEKFYLKQELADSFLKRLAERGVSNTIRCGGAGSTDEKHTWDLVAIRQIGNLYKNNPQRGRIYGTDGISACLDTMSGGNREPMILQNPHGFNNGGVKKDVSPTITSTGNFAQNNFVLKPDVRIRKLTPKECWRLMGFNDEEYEAAEKAGVSKTQLYKQAGNSIVVDVLSAIFKNLFQV